MTERVEPRLSGGRRLTIESPARAGGGLRRTVFLPLFSEAIMRAMLSIALVLGVCGVADAQSEKVNPDGTWKCEYEIGGQKRTSTLTIKTDGDKIAGTMSWPDQKETALKDLKLTDGTLTFSAVRKLMDREIPVNYTLTIAGDKLQGKGVSDYGGEKREWDITATREK
jgi:major membrane immunogen (membrane-anchored lipoprotein)